MAIIRLVNGEIFNGKIKENRGEVFLIEMQQQDSQTGEIRHICVRTIPFNRILSIDYF
jgi:methyl coenzyme M reductase subunit D